MDAGPEGTMWIRHLRDRKRIKEWSVVAGVAFFIFIVQRVFVRLLLLAAPHAFWDPYNILPSGMVAGGSWAFFVPLPLYIEIYFSTFIGTAVINKLYRNDRKRARFVSAMAALAGTMPTIAVILTSLHPCFCQLTVFVSSKYEVVLWMLLFLAGGSMSGMVTGVSRAAPEEKLKTVQNTP